MEEKVGILYEFREFHAIVRSLTISATALTLFLVSVSRRAGRPAGRSGWRVLVRIDSQMALAEIRDSTHK